MDKKLPSKMVNGYRIEPGANLREADLNGANLMHANLREADLNGADLNGANLMHANLREADLNGANLREADLMHADLNGANLREADLMHADLRDADLRDADLRDANLRSADLTGTVMPNGSVASSLVVRLARAGACTPAILWAAEMDPNASWRSIYEAAKPEWKNWLRENGPELLEEIGVETCARPR